MTHMRKFRAHLSQLKCLFRLQGIVLLTFCSVLFIGNSLVVKN
jgi:hypothetical protein